MSECVANIEAGLVIDGQYRIEYELGEGGMGRVWVASDLRLGRKVAIKFPTEELRSNPEAIARFLREPRLAGKIQSPHVIQVFGQGTTPDGLPYIVMELLEGRDLSRHIAEHAPCSLAQAGSIIEQVVRALGRAHEAGLVHRDIKPSNVFVTPQRDGQLFVKVLDFGIAKDVGASLSALTRTRTGIGSLPYMSPEQLLDSQSVGRPTDIWALGVLTFELLTGSLPFDSPHEHVMLRLIKRGEFTPASELRPDLPRSVDAFLARALQPDPALRYANIEAMGEAFAGIVRAHASESAKHASSGLGRAPVEVAGQTLAGPRSQRKRITLWAATALAMTMPLGVYAVREGWREAPAMAPTPPAQTTKPSHPPDATPARQAPVPTVEAQPQPVATGVGEPSPATEVETGPSKPRPAVEASRNGTPEPDPRAVPRRPRAKPELSPPSEAVRAKIIAAIDRVDMLERRAKRTLDASPLAAATSGRYLQDLQAAVKTLRDRNEFISADLRGRKIESILVTKDQLTAEVRMIEAWETSWFDRRTNLCKAHLHVHNVPQTVRLAAKSGSWIVTAVEFPNQVAQPQFVACH